MSTKLKLIQSGGFAGMILSAETETDLTETEIREAATAAVQGKLSLQRDNIHHVLVINGKDEIAVDLLKLKGKLKEVVNKELFNKLKH